MKKIILALALLMGTASFYGTTEAQNINISINIGRQPAWGPVGYDYAAFYYFPDMDCYYDVNIGMFYYMDRGRWISARYLPYAYRNYDLYRIHKVVLNVREPWRYHRSHYRDYARYKGHRKQVVIRDSRDARYRDSRKNKVVWYSSDKPKNHRKDNNYKNNNRRPDTNYSKGKKHNDNHRRDNNKYSPKDNKKDYNKSDRNRNDNRPKVNRENNRPKTDNKNNSNRGRGNYNSPKNSDKNKNTDAGRTKRTTSRRTAGYHLAANSANTI